MRCPGGKPGPTLPTLSGGPMGPGLRRESVLVAVSCTAGRQRRWGTNKNQVGWRRQVILNTSPAKEGVIQLACRKMVENFRLHPRVFDRIYQSAIGTPGRISERFLLQTKAIAHFRQPRTEKANWITRSF